MRKSVPCLEPGGVHNHVLVFSFLPFDREFYLEMRVHYLVKIPTPPQGRGLLRHYFGWYEDCIRCGNSPQCRFRVEPRKRRGLTGSYQKLRQRWMRRSWGGGKLYRRGKPQCQELSLAGEEERPWATSRTNLAEDYWWVYGWRTRIHQWFKRGFWKRKRFLRIHRFKRGKR